ncbi:hypothetical protein BGX24_012752 [Mortierella sp. AD032]|nr:hypothetical protein BGX24_012752 [Mortierella sp. AD032]
MDTRGPPSSSSSSQAPYQRVPSPSSAQIMDPNNINDHNVPSAATAVAPTGLGLSTGNLHNNGTGTGGYVYPDSSTADNNHFNPASYGNNSQNPFQYPDQEDQTDNQLSSSAPLRLDDDPHNNDNFNSYDEPSTAYLIPTITPPGKILLLQTLTTLSTIVFTVIPVVIKAGPEESWGHWYTWKDAVRLIEPFVSGLFHSWFFYSSDLMTRWRTPRSVGGYDEEEERKNHTSSVAGPLWGDVALDDKQGRGGGINGINNGQGTSSGSNTLLDDRHRQNDQQKQLQHQEYHSPPRSRSPSSSWKQTPTFKALLANVFTFFLILYVTGAAIHTAAAFFKNILVLFLEQYSQGIGLSTHPPTTGDGQLSMALASQLKEGYLLIQDTWEHNISHYMYAFGALGMSWCEMVAYSGQVLPVGVNLARVGQVSTNSRLGVRSRKSSKRLVLLWILAGVLYGGIVAGVACQYPKGLYVGLVYIGALFLILVVYILSHPTRGLFTLGRHYILQTYLISTVVAAVAIVIYLAMNDFKFLTSNDKSHLASTTRP